MSKSRAAWTTVLFLPAAVCWFIVVFLAAIEVLHVMREDETEHSPLLVLAYILPLAVALTVAAMALRRALSRDRR